MFVTLLAVFVVMPSASQDLNEEVLALVEEVERLALEHDVWPGFEALSIPLAIYDGEYTYLLRHPAPPEGFILHGDAPSGVYRYEGRYPTVVANTPAEIGEVLAAGIMIDRRDPSHTLTDLAGVALHEAFHVHQLTHFPDWRANEADFFIYPVEEADLLTYHRLETRALRRALASDRDDDAACWSRTALARREQRYAAMDSAFVAYERRTELNEGLAIYVEYRFADRTVDSLLETDHHATDVRRRPYATGAALASLLNRFYPEWKRVLTADDEQYLDVILSEALARTASTASCTFEEAEVADVAKRAQEDVAHLLEERIAQRRAFDERPGWRVVIEAADTALLWPQGFDPMNVQRVDGGVLHTRWLRLGNEAGTMEAIADDTTDVALLTVGAGEHPLFHGVKEVIFTGLPEPEITESEGVVELQGAGFSATFERAHMERADNAVRIRIGSE